MAVKFFVLGLPGSGKSSATRYIETLANKRGMKNVSRINDYDMLYQMFRDDTDRQQFSPIDDPEGFDVHDLKVFDTVLQRIEKYVQEKEKLRATLPEIVLIEFSRNDYCQALRLFSAAFLQDAYFLFIHADIPTCRRRIQYRSTHRPTGTLDDHSVSDYIFETYYNWDNQHYDLSPLNDLCDSDGHYYAISKQQEKNLSNGRDTSEQDFYNEIERFFLQVFDSSQNIEPSPLLERETVISNAR